MTSEAETSLNIGRVKVEVSALGWLPHGDRIAKMVRTGEFWNPAHMPH